MSNTPRTDGILRWIIFACKTPDQLDAMAEHACELERENAALRADRDRMDWLAENTEITIKKVVSGFLIFEHNEIIWSEDKGKLREKIDAARKEDKQ